MNGLILKNFQINNRIYGVVFVVIEKAWYVQAGIDLKVLFIEKVMHMSRIYHENNNEYFFMSGLAKSERLKYDRNRYLEYNKTNGNK